jgi:hypothetical protein
MNWREKLLSAYLVGDDISDASKSFVTSVSNVKSATRHSRGVALPPAPALVQVERPSTEIGTAERGMPWEEWHSAEIKRIFKEARRARKRASRNSLQLEKLQSSATPFQRRFFDRLSLVRANSDTEFLKKASALGIPAECSQAYLWNRRAPRIELK